MFRIASIHNSYLVQHDHSPGNLEVKTLIRRDDGPWIPNSPVTISEHPDDFLVVLPPGGREYQ